jgi:Putative zinc-finger
MVEHRLACADWQEDLAGWLMAQLAPEREARLVAHLETCAACRHDAESLLAVTAVALAADPEESVGLADAPPPDLGDRIVAAISSERRTRRIARSVAVGLASAAAAIVAVVALQADGPSPLEGESVAFTVVPPGATVDAVIADEGRGSIVQLTASGLDPGVTYALWLSPPRGTWDDRVAAGTFRPDERGEVDARLRCALPADEYGRAWATTPGGEIALDTK